MSLPIDHVVIAVARLGDAIASYEHAGFTVVEGGRHPGRPTRNALVVFGDGAYIELITYEAPAPQERWWRVLSAHGEGLVDFALLPRDIHGVVAAARARGLQDLEERPGSRARPDGVQIAWHSARPASADLPFLCADVTPRALRVPEGAVRLHANGALGIAQVDVAVGDLDASLGRYRALLGPEAVQGETVLLAGARVRFTRAARARGDGPCLVTLRGPSRGALPAGLAWEKDAGVGFAEPGLPT